MGEQYFAEAIKAKEDSLEHHGVLGQKWGVRRYQNADGSLTAAGKRRVYAQGADGGYESFRHRHRRAIEAAKYENDLKKNQKKLDKAYEKGNEKKIAKYTKAEEILKKNRGIYTKDLSSEEIQMGRDYITTMKTTVIATALGGPIVGAGTGLAVRAINKMADTEKKVYAQEAERKKDWNEVEKAKKAYVDYQINQPADEYSPMYSQKLAKDYQDKKQEYNDKRNSIKTDEDKDLWERQQAATTRKERNAAINDRVKLAKKTGMYDMEFLEGNYDVDDATGDQLQGKALDDAYRKFLKENNSYGVNMHK